MKSEQNILLCTPNWLGDAVMSLPAVHALQKSIPALNITVLTKSSLLEFWKMVEGIINIISYRADLADTFRIAMSIRRHGFTHVFIFPNSFRSAFIPFLGGVPIRTGLRGFCRAYMLTDVVESPSKTEPEKQHQAWDYMAILRLTDKYTELQLPFLQIPEPILQACREQLRSLSSSIFIGLFPGAARGPSKRWHAEHFIEMAQKLQKSMDICFLIFGTGHEMELCENVRAGIGMNAINLAGKTTLPQLAGFLKLCDIVVSNDSGGMHLATAVGTKVVAIFGMTDPSRTGPLGHGHRVVSPPGIKRSVAIPRHSAEAERILRSISPASVVAVVMEMLDKKLSERTK